MIGVLPSRKQTKVLVWSFGLEMTTSKKPKISRRITPFIMI